MTPLDTQTAPSDLPARARNLLKSSLVWDNHACMPLRAGDDTFLPQLSRWREVGVDIVSLNVGFATDTLEQHLRVMASFRRWVALHSDAYAMVGSLADLDRARAAGKLTICFDVEGMAVLDKGDQGIVAAFRDLGVRWMLIAYNRNSLAGGGCYDVDPGLSAHGKAILAEMKRVGMVVCCSHTGHRTVRDVFEHADNPVIFSHSNSSALNPHERNISDDLIRGCAATGGVVGINGIRTFLGPGDQVERFVDHVDHAVQLVGPDHVGIGLDLVVDLQELADYLATRQDLFPDTESNKTAYEMVAPEQLPAIVETLLKRGYADADIAKILGGNWRRVAAQVWK